jgi:hypothetical protein
MGMVNSKLIPMSSRHSGCNELSIALPGTTYQPIAATDNLDSGHVQFFTVTQLQRLFDDCYLRVFRKGSASFLAGPLVGHTLARSQRFVDWNSRVTNKLPQAFASGWYFALRKVT